MAVVPFARLVVDFIVAGGGRVSWELNRHFVDPTPYAFQLQVGHSGNADADDWVDVGSPVVDTYFALDTDKRLWGKTLDTHYRVQLTTPVDTYYSTPQNCFGPLSKRDWIYAKEMTRKELLRHRVYTSVAGYLLKARRYGPRCPDCVDRYTDEVSKANCLTCFGVGYLYGYFDPISAVYADVSLETNREHRDEKLGMEKKDVITARFIGDPQLYSYDVFVEQGSDQRYYLHEIEVKAQHRGVPLVYQAELRQAPFTDVIYTLPLQTFSQGKRQLTAKAGTPCPTEVKHDLNYLEAALVAIREKNKRRKRER